MFNIYYLVDGKWKLHDTVSGPRKMIMLRYLSQCGTIKVRKA